MKKSFLLTVGALAATSSIAFAQPAQSQNSFYMGVSVGQTKIDTGVSGLTGTASLDESDTGYKIFGGYQFDQIWGVELQYADFGKASLKGNNGDRFTFEGTQYEFLANNSEVSVKAKSLGAAIVAGYNVSSVVRPYVKLGLHRWDSDASVSSNAGNISISDNGTDPFYGIGVQFSITDQLAARIEAEHYKYDREKAQLISAALMYRF
jgi:OmpA-OmpF porin, OOP family